MELDGLCFFIVGFDLGFFGVCFCLWSGFCGSSVRVVIEGVGCGLGMESVWGLVGGLFLWECGD